MASIVSINISTAKGERKKPAGAAELRPGHGLAGDGHAGDWHRQVSLLASESIDTMRAKGLDVGPGDFAENITTLGIDLPSLPVGTRLRLGTALVEVTQIGKECHNRCDIFRQAGDCVMPRDGIFARVLAGGTISDGDPIKIQKTQGHHAICLQGESPGELQQPFTGFSAAIITVSDKCHQGEREDGSGDLLERLLAAEGADSVTRILVPDERGLISSALERLCGSDDIRLIITTGGTGLQQRDVTPEATRDVIERETPGISEAIRAQSLTVTPRAMLSRAVSGIRGGTLIINFPGSPKACQESFAVISPVMGHALELLAGDSGDCARR